MHKASALDGIVTSPSGKRIEWGWFPALAFSAAAGLLLCSVANALSRATEEPSPLLLWAGILLIALPIFYRLTSRDASPGERFALVCLLGLALYGVKLTRDAPIFTFSDELIHAFNSNQVSEHNHLFHANPVLDISRYYPGLEGATSALRSLTGLSSFAAGAIVIGTARLTLMSAMFLLFWRVSDSHRVAGIGTAIFTGNFNFLLWSAQYSYESLALPLLMVILLIVVEVDLAPGAARGAWRLLAAIAIAAVVVTHHITSYATLVVLTALSAAAWLVRRRPNPWPLALLTAVLTAFWLFVVASATVGYLSPVLGKALTSTLHTVVGEAPARELFKGDTSTIGDTPTLARGIALLAVLLLVVALPFGLHKVWRSHRNNPIALVFAAAAIGFFAVLALRLAPDAWETGNRASSFLFVGLAFVVAYTGLELWRPRFFPWLGRASVAAGLGIVLVGGAITGWPWDSQLALPVRAQAKAGGTIHSPPLATARWARQNVRHGIFAALTADSRLLLDPGGKTVFSDYTADIVDILPDADLEPWAVPLLRRHGVRFVVADQREVGNDGIRGYYLSIRGSRRNALLPRSAVTKFGSVPGAERLYDNGSIIVYDISGTANEGGTGKSRAGR